MIEKLTSSDRRRIKKSLKYGQADIFDVLNAFNSGIISTSVLKCPDTCKCFSGYVYPLTKETVQDRLWDEKKSLLLRVKNMVEQQLKPNIVHSIISKNYKKYNWYPILLDDPERKVTKQEILKYHYLVMQRLIKWRNQSTLNKVKTPFDIKKIHLLESNEILNSFISLFLFIDNYCEMVDYLKKSWDIDLIDTSKLTHLFNKYIRIKSNNKNFDKIEIINQIRNCLRHNKYTVVRDGTVHINDKWMILDLNPNFFDDFVRTYIELLERDYPLNVNFNQILLKDIKKWKIDFNEIAKNGVYDFSQIKREKWLENNINNIFTNNWRQIILNDNQVDLLKKYFSKNKFDVINLWFVLSWIVLNMPINKIYVRKNMQAFLNALLSKKKYIINQSNSTSDVINNYFKMINWSNSFSDTIKNYIKLQCIKFHYINKSDLNLRNDVDRHLTNCFTHWWYTENLFNGEIFVQDKNYNKKTWVRTNTHEAMYDINKLYMNIEFSWWFSSLFDKEQDDLGWFVVWNIRTNKTNDIIISLMPYFFDSDESEFKDNDIFEYCNWEWSMRQ